MVPPRLAPVLRGLVSTGLFLDAMIAGAIVPLLPYLVAHFGGSEQTVANLIAVGYGATLAAMLPSTFLLLNTGHLPVLTMGLTALLVSCALLGLNHSLWQLYGALVLMGASAEFLFAAALAMVTKLQSSGYEGGARSSQEGGKEPALEQAQVATPHPKVLRRALSRRALATNYGSSFRRNSGDAGILTALRSASVIVGGRQSIRALELVRTAALNPNRAVRARRQADVIQAPESGDETSPAADSWSPEWLNRRHTSPVAAAAPAEFGVPRTLTSVKPNLPVNPPSSFVDPFKVLALISPQDASEVDETTLGLILLLSSSHVVKWVIGGRILPTDAIVGEGTSEPVDCELGFRAEEKQGLGRNPEVQPSTCIEGSAAKFEISGGVNGRPEKSDSGESEGLQTGAKALGECQAAPERDVQLGLTPAAIPEPCNERMEGAALGAFAEGGEQEESTSDSDSGGDYSGYCSSEQSDDSASGGTKGIFGRSNALSRTSATLTKDSVPEEKQGRTQIVVESPEISRENLVKGEPSGRPPSVFWSLVGLVLLSAHAFPAILVIFAEALLMGAFDTVVPLFLKDTCHVSAAETGLVFGALALAYAGFRTGRPRG
ncbi:hypothetical protein KFL_001400225 [Klebsormidium nitens]|uniref:Major facilitator superfamily protein n=1 Tax=Klebsormidium nitens TaxID=105231 RepID=A0A1Y1I1C1_KLENI|nr:hypothetical protein KFL_001400225 [Klebsormidium nitens]|eukprot:GAQ83239.1 hypothetical protein KFL_001400225 [Klebsormidium nitens]